ncbi:phosphoadenylyl-sulfate reductase [Allobranchiibius sp. GilTou73]|uniref:phosphoadenylyl-sulfate reductase n=1 Tax=Allobranchiibius sp. GilTou73 TaxID=2904523 RepID=UPI001F32920E|nr:phosphoadenylyl-sulfate reductase [Allobranchiibius sp. GilTou73]UIJ34423.1 phosphoadenylyl-sulfate reductase [Allobranchiibius sp. GilTou73]
MTVATDLREVAANAARELEGASASDVIGWAGTTFGDRFAVAASMQDTVLLHLASSILPGVDALFLDTGYHFAETLQVRDRVARYYPVNVVSLTPAQTVAEQDDTYGARLYERDPDLCCALRKTHPLDEALDGYDAWATGLRRVESASRANTPVVSFDERRERIKIAPLAAWSDQDIDDYVREHGVIMNQLLSQGYPSIGCETCTARVAPGADPRSGRWSGTDKVECGIHL